MNNYYPVMTAPYRYNHHYSDQRIAPAVGLGLGFLGGLATGALLAPGPGFGYGYRPYPYPYYYCCPYPYYPYYPYYR
ncbi:hypothetical protein RJD24_12440 [Bacillaceae bacterium IKA-2]|nr:hypothetical protein RJD24_12440 [Bacillaceae bacterium IKA-2]